MPDDARKAFIQDQLALSRDASAANRLSATRRLHRTPVRAAWEAGIQRTGLTHWKNRPGWLFRSGHIEHITTTAKFLLDNQEALLAAAPIRSILLMKATDKELARLAKQRWLSQVECLGLVVKPTVAIAPLLNADALENVRELQINWVSEEVWDRPRDLGSKAIADLIASPILKQLRQLRMSVAEAKDAEAICAAVTGVVDFGLCSRKQFSPRQAECIAQCMDMPELRRFSAPVVIAPEGCANLTDAHFANGARGIPEAFGAQLVTLSISMAGSKDLASLSGSQQLRSLTIQAITSTTERGLLWSRLANGEWPALRSLTVRGFSLEADQMPRMQRHDWLGRLDTLQLKTAKREVAVALVSDLQDLSELDISWDGSTTPGTEIPAPRGLHRLAITGCYGDMAHYQPAWHSKEPGNICQAVCEADLPKLELLSIAGVGNQVSLGVAGAEALVAAPAPLQCVWARLGELDEQRAHALHERFVLYDGGVHAGPLDMTSWKWRGHTWHLDTLDV